MKTLRWLGLSFLGGANFGCVIFDILINNYSSLTILNFVAAILCMARAMSLTEGTLGGTDKKPEGTTDD